MAHKILIVGSPGSGKSTLAVQLHKDLKVPVYHLDDIQWIDDGTTISKADFESTLRNILQQNEWIIDGNYSDTIPLRLKEATVVIWLQAPRVICLKRVIQRVIKSKIGNSKILGGNPKTIDFDFLKFVWNFPQQHSQLEFLQQQSSATWIKGRQSHNKKALKEYFRAGYQ
ncbi:AAA family ATPase [Staphylococcus simiae]|uniref:Topology modulation protein n=1 Tax=Staphylococcus simiae CCM 7213 = CCUG 51256 TaxID=911238 RepID=G5JIC6_9STAP|nr:AAA family ATPase [Staphylococcus simiae]EHJ08083.1 hypothetical protein SS7213T_06061 [Staphylococcus simiae CCM 7213 = CCUG 51256]SNV83097.1 putative DNA topology modulation protein FlaR [Staphylococcus simiae]